jgi:AcrR family transcriptional regulator
MGADGDLTAEARIRRSALRLFAERGFEGTTTRAIAEAAGVSPGLVLHHFGTKEALRERVDTDVIAVVDRIFSAMYPEGKPANFDVWQDGYRRLFHEDDALPAYLRRGLLEGSSATRGLFLKMMEFAEHFLVLAVERGEARRPTDLQATVALLASMSLTSVLLAEEFAEYVGDGQPMETRLAEAQLEFMQLGFFESEPVETTAASAPGGPPCAV